MKKIYRTSELKCFPVREDPVRGWFIPEPRKSIHSGHGRIYEACNENSCDYILKFGYFDDIEKEAKLNNLASQDDLTKPVLDHWMCGKVQGTDDPVGVFVMPRLKETLYDRLKKVNNISEEWYYIKQVLSLVYYLHELGIFHGDINANNFMFDENDKMYIIDFRKATTFEDGEKAKYKDSNLNPMNDYYNIFSHNTFKDNFTKHLRMMIDIYRWLIGRGFSEVDAETLMLNEILSLNASQVIYSGKSDEIKTKLSRTKPGPEIKPIFKAREGYNVSGQMYMIRYKNSLAILGDTKPWKENIKALGGNFNQYLNIGGQKKPGWLFFDKSRESEIAQFVKNANEGKIQPQIQRGIPLTPTPIPPPITPSIPQQGHVVLRDQRGLIEAEGNMVSGKREGDWKLYDENGLIEQIGEYRNGGQVGIWVTYNESGTINSKGASINGKREGMWDLYYEDTGSLNAFGKFKNDVQVGKWKVFDKKGRFKEDKYY